MSTIVMDSKNYCRIEVEKIGYIPNVLAADVHVYPEGSIQENINDASNGDVIIVHQGTYMENIDFLGKAITLRSTNPNDLQIVHDTVIDGNSTGSVVIFSNEEGTDSILSGISVRNGRANNERAELSYSLYRGGGIYCSSSSPTITNCIIIDNTGSGIFFSSSSSSKIKNCTIKENMGDGIQCSSSSPMITNCAIIDNMGGGILCSVSSPTIVNCTISGNMASNGFGGICCDESSPIITNCILWNNSGQGISIVHHIWGIISSPKVTYSNVNYTGVGNIDDDPSFVRSKDGNYYLRPDSPCIDTGTSTNAPSEDGEGIARPQGSGIDMGAYEYVEPSSCIPRASFKANQTTGTDSLTVEFDASSSGGSQYSGVSFSWDFGDGASGNGLMISHAYTNYGSYNVSLTVTTECGSHRLTLSDLIKIRSSQVTKEVGEGQAYATIQAAIDDAGYGEMILVHDGTYIENINFKGKGITVLSENGAATTIIDGGGSGSVVTFDHCKGIDPVLKGFTLQNGLAYRGAGIYCRFSSPIISSCTIRGNLAANCSYCSYSYSSGDIDFYYDDYCESYGGGVYCISSSLTISNCTISGNRSDVGGGIYCQSSSPTIANCTISDNIGDGIHCSSSSSTITNCILWNNIPEEISGSSPTVTYSDIKKDTGIHNGEGNINDDPLFVRSESGNHYLMPNSPCIDTGSSTNAPPEDKEGIVRPQGSGIDMGAYEHVESFSCIPKALFIANQTIGTDSLTVDFDASSSGGSQYSSAVFSWDFGDGTSGAGLTTSHTYMGYGYYDVSLTITTECGSHLLTLSDLIKIKSSQVTKEVGAGYPYTSIQAAIDDASYGEMILVHDGTYMENINFKGKGVRVVSENGTASTTIDGDGSGSGVTFDNGENKDSELHGFNIQNGSSDYGSGIYCDRSSPMIINCTINDNTAKYRGGGIYCQIYSSPTITDCIISNNIAGNNGGGIYCESSSSPTITNCIIYNNMIPYNGGGIYCTRYSSPTIISCTINNNTGSGIYCGNSSSPIITNCIVTNNTAEEDGGGILCTDSSPTIINCSIIGNNATKGGGIYCSFSSPTIKNCVINDNKSEYNSEDYGGGICCRSNSSPMIINCIINGNIGSGIFCRFSSSSPTITNCILWNNLPEEISGGSPTVTYSDIKQDTGIHSGEGNINADPLFVGSESGNYYLMPNSPCIDTGTSTNAPSEDKEGITRPQGSGIDMGVYEYVGPTSCTPRALFTTNQTTGSDSLTVEFDASSSGGSQYSGAVFSWDFGDGTSGNDLMISHTYTDYGSYDVSLTITTECGSHQLTLSDLIWIKSSQVTKEVGEGQAYTSIQAAIDDAGYGEMILVHDGTYMENINFKGKGLTVFSENGVSTTIIDGSGNGSVVTFDHNENMESVLAGFTIKNGLKEKGGGIFCLNSSPVITNCIIFQNIAYSDGGGIYSYNAINAMPTIINCLLLGNNVEGMPNQICIKLNLATYNDIQIFECKEDNRIHIQRYNQFTGIWRSYYRFFGKQCGTAIPLQDDEFLYISFFP